MTVLQIITTIIFFVAFIELIIVLTIWLATTFYKFYRDAHKAKQQDE